MTVTHALRGLYVITPNESDTQRLLDRVTQVLKARPALLQYRNKTADAALRASQARALAELCRQHAVPLIINDDLALAVELGAGLHIGADDGDVAHARSQLGTDAILGVSCYGDIASARHAIADGASYVAFGSVFASPTKPDAPRVSVPTLAAACTELAVPVCAIGGIQLANAHSLVTAGVSLLALISDVFDAADPQQHAEHYRKLFDRPVAD